MGRKRNNAAAALVREPQPVPSHMVGRCVGCGVVRRVRLWASITDSCVTGLQAVWEMQGLEVTREAAATVKPCRCREIASSVRRLVPDLTQCYEALIERDEESRTTIAILHQALEMALPLVPEYTGNGEFSRDDVQAALKASRGYWDDYPRGLQDADKPEPDEATMAAFRKLLEKKGKANE